jgi:hypothetical protein
MKKTKAFRFAIGSVIALGAIVLGGAYGYGSCRGYSAARAVKAAEQGRPEAQNNLGRMYQNGDGVEQDEVEALAWAIVAGERGVRDLLALLQALGSYPHIRVRAEDRAEQLAAEIARQREARWRIPPAVPAEVDDIIIVKSPIIIRGIYGSVKGTDGSRSAGVRGGASTIPPCQSTEMSVMGALRWFKTTQQEGGSWREAGLQTPTVTALVLLTYLAHGESPDSPEFGQTVMNAMRYLLESRNDEASSGGREVALGEQAIVTWALCEAYALTQHPYSGAAAEAGIAAILSKQGKSGLWSESDRVKGVPASIWCIIALHAAHIADLSHDSVEAACRAAGDALLASLENPRPSTDMPPIILALQLMGHARKPAVRSAIEQLDDMTMDWEAPESTHPVSHWYFMTQLAFNQGGNMWKEWNRSFSPQLLKHQTIIADAIDIPHADRLAEICYWDPPGLQAAHARTSSTALCCLMLEIYYHFRNSRMFMPVSGAGPGSLEAADDVDIEIIE